MAVNKARQRFEDKKQRNEIIRQLNALKSAGFTTEDIRGAGKDAWTELGGPDLVSQGNGLYTVGDGDTVSTIADKTKTTVPNILAANPDLRKIKTGMVINTSPVPGSEQWRAQQGGIGVPSAGPIGGVQGGLSPTFQGNTLGKPYRPNKNMWAGTTPGYNQPPGAGNMWANTTPGYNRPFQEANALQTLVGYNPNRTLTNDPAIQNRLNNASYNVGNVFNRLVGKAPFVTPNSSGSPDDRDELGRITSAAALINTPKTLNTPNAFKTDTKFGDSYYRLQFMQLIANGYVPSKDQMDYLVRIGWVQPPTTPPTSEGGGYSGNYRRRGGGGGGGRGGGGSAAATRTVSGGQARPSAFSTGAGFKGLINWRI